MLRKETQKKRRRRKKTRAPALFLLDGREIQEGRKNPPTKPKTHTHTDAVVIIFW
jgi:hypothetical protein